MCRVWNPEQKLCGRQAVILMQDGGFGFSGLLDALNRNRRTMIVGKEQQTWDICARHCNSHWTLTPTTESGASWVRNTLPNGNERVNGHTFAPVLLEKPTDGSLTRLLDAASEAGLRVHVVERSEERQHFSPKQLETLWLEVETPSWPG